MEHPRQQKVDTVCLQCVWCSHQQQKQQKQHTCPQRPLSCADAGEARRAHWHLQPGASWPGADQTQVPGSTIPGKGVWLCFAQRAETPHRRLTSRGRGKLSTVLACAVPCSCCSCCRCCCCWQEPRAPRFVATPGDGSRPPLPAEDYILAVVQQPARQQQKGEQQQQQQQKDARCARACHYCCTATSSSPPLHKLALHTHTYTHSMSADCKTQLAQQA